MAEPEFANIRKQRVLVNYVRGLLCASIIAINSIVMTVEQLVNVNMVSGAAVVKIVSEAPFVLIKNSEVVVVSAGAVNYVSTHAVVSIVPNAMEAQYALIN